MMNQAMDEFELARNRMAGDFRTMITDGEDLLKAAATVSGEGFTAARAKFEKQLKGARASLADASQPVLDKTREAAAVASKYAHSNPWAVAGAAIAVGVLIGFLVAKR